MRHRRVGALDDAARGRKRAARVQHAVAVEQRDRAAAVRALQFLREQAGGGADLVHVRQHRAEEEIVQHHQPRHLVQQLDHVRVERRIAELVDHLIVVGGLGAQLAPRQHPAGAGRVLDRGHVGAGVDVHVHAHGQRRQQLGDVIGDAGLLRPHRRHQRDLEPAFHRHHRIALRAPLDRIGPGLAGQLGGALPGELARAAQAALAQALAQAFVGEHAGQAGGRIGHRRGVEQRILAPDHFRQAGIVAGDRRRAAGHRLQHRQAETFVQRREEEHVAGAEQLLERAVADPAGDDQIVRAQARARSGLAHRALVADLVEHQLHAAALIARNRGEGLDRAAQVLAQVAVAGIEHEAVADAELVLDRRALVGRGRVEEMLVHAGVDHRQLFLGDAEQAHRVGLGRLGDAQDRIELAKVQQLAPIPPALVGRAQVQLREDFRNQVVQRHRTDRAGHPRQLAEPAGVFDETLEQAVDVDHLRRGGAVALPDQGLGRRTQRVLRPMRAGRLGIGVAEQAGVTADRLQFAMDIADRRGVGFVDAEQVFVVLAPAGQQRLGQPHGVPADAAQARLGLARLQIDGDSHPRDSLPVRLTCADDAGRRPPSS